MTLHRKGKSYWYHASTHLQSMYVEGILCFDCFSRLQFHLSVTLNKLQLQRRIKNLFGN